ncbi:unnamed protein product [Merluccius merluccius]
MTMTTTTTHPSLPEECSERNSYLLCLHNPQQIISLLTSRDKTTREDDPRSRLRKKKKTAQRRKPPPPRLAAVLPFVLPPLAAGRRSLFSGVSPRPTCVAVWRVVPKPFVAS